MCGPLGGATSLPAGTGMGTMAAAGRSVEGMA